MTGEWLDISRIEDFFFTLLKGKAFGEVTVGGKLTDTLSKTMTRATLIDCSPMTDYNGYGYGKVLVYLFSKSAGNGKKNVPIMYEMEEALRNAINGCMHKHYIVSRERTYADYDSKYDMHCNIVEINLTII